MKFTIVISLFLSFLLTLSADDAESVDSCFRAIASGTADKRSKAVSQLVRWLQSGESKQIESVVFYAWDSSPLRSGGVIHHPDREHCKNILEAVPNLIDALRTDQRKEAWYILICLTNYCPTTTDYDVWHTWWETKGHKFFVSMADSK